MSTADFDIEGRGRQIPEAERAVLEHHCRLHGDGAYTAVGTVNRGC